MVPARDRTRNYKEGYLTYLTSNLLPQLKIAATEPWNDIEDFTDKLVKAGRELYIIDGGYGTKADVPPDSISIINGINVPARLWKVIVELNPGDNISDINESTRIFAFDMPNDGGVEGLEWFKYSVNIKTLEESLASTGLNYKFFSNVRENIRQELENKGTINSALLLAATNESLISSFGTFNNVSIGQDSSPKESIIEISSITPPTLSISQSSADQSGRMQINLIQNSSIQNRSTQIDSSHISTGKNGFSSNRPIDSSVTQVSPSEISSGQKGAGQTSSEQSSTRQVGQTQVDSFQVGSTQVNAPQINITQIGSEILISTQIDPSKITFSSSIPSQQFLSSNLPNHLNTSELTNVESTAVTIWNNLLNPTTPINLNFAITNLPTGQLAEATITGYDKLGRPNTATISIDDDANGVGWFLDTTPADNSEFTGTDNYLQATPNSPASGKYDLLTAILHEMGHTLGFINGYSQFNQNIKGRQFYIDPTHSYTLSSDLSHLDNTLYPNDLLNTNLKPGIRKLPSAMDWAIINAIPLLSLSEQ
jgi:hypothetical protein